jgi:hypothetical protein
MQHTPSQGSRQGAFRGRSTSGWNEPASAAHFSVDNPADVGISGNIEREAWGFCGGFSVDYGQLKMAPQRRSILPSGLLQRLAHCGRPGGIRHLVVLLHPGGNLPCRESRQAQAGFCRLVHLTV